MSTQRITLYDIETNLQHLAELSAELQYQEERDIIDRMDEEEQQQSIADLQTEIARILAEYEEAILHAPEKRDAVGKYILSMDRQCQFAKAEAQRLALRARSFERAAKIARQRVLETIRALPKVGDKYQVLKGHQMTLRSWKNSQPTVVVDEKAKLPAEYYQTTITMPLDVWERIQAEMLAATEAQFKAACLRAEGGEDSEVRPSRIAQHIKDGGTVEGAHLEDGYHVRIV